MMKKSCSNSVMKGIRVCVSAAVLTLLVASPAGAALINKEIVSGQPVVYDDVSKLYWISNILLLADQTYGYQIDTTIAGFNTAGYGGFTGWHMAYSSEVNTLETALSVSDPNLFFTPTVSGEALRQWSGRIEDTAAPNVHYYVVFKDINDSSHSFGSVDDIATDPISDLTSSYKLSAWVVTEAAPVPIPAAAWLLGSGLIGLVGIGRLRLKNNG